MWKLHFRSWHSHLQCIRKEELLKSGMDRRDGSTSWVTTMGFSFLTLNSALAIYRSRHDVGSVMFVAVAYLTLLLLFQCLRLYEKAPQDSTQREWHKAGVWVSTTMLTVMFSHEVVVIMSPLVALVVWGVAFVAMGGGFTPRSSTRAGLPRRRCCTCI